MSFPARIATLLALLVLGALPASPARAADPLPPSPAPSYILDLAGWLTPAEHAELDRRLTAAERATSSQLVVAVLPKLPDGWEEFDFCQRVFESWKPGRKGRDNGAVLFFFASDHHCRIHVGRGLEGALPDARCLTITADVILPPWRDGRPAEAVRAGVRAILAATAPEYQGDGGTVGQGKPETPIPPLVWVAIVALYLLLALRYPSLFNLLQLVFWLLGQSSSSRGNNNRRGGGFSGGGGDSGGGGAGSSW